MSWVPEVVADSTGKWLPNRLRFETKVECERYLADLMMRWTAVQKVRAVETDDTVNCRIDGNKLVHLSASEGSPEGAPVMDAIMKALSADKLALRTALAKALVVLRREDQRGHLETIGKSVIALAEKTLDDTKAIRREKEHL